MKTPAKAGIRDAFRELDLLPDLKAEDSLLPHGNKPSMHTAHG